ncbi:MAG TPA: dockerin type I domain-containing protein [Phycisphaerae bacterium]|nr:dockerin type I domain-containing protein [Phycisphaerae bacterium]
MSATPASGSCRAGTRPGWNIDDVEIWAGVNTTDLVADLNGDGVVDIQDFAVLADCLTGPEVPPATGCENADLDQDVDVDLADFSVFQLHFGAGRWPATLPCGRLRNKASGTVIRRRGNPARTCAIWLGCCPRSISCMPPVAP